MKTVVCILAACMLCGCAASNNYSYHTRVISCVQAPDIYQVVTWFTDSAGLVYPSMLTAVGITASDTARVVHDHEVAARALCNQNWTKP